jgi:hypothetical protein
MMSADLVRATARSLRSSGGLSDAKARSAAALLRRIAGMIDQETATATADAADTAATLAGLAPDSGVTDVESALAWAAAHDDTPEAGEVRKLARRQLDRRLALLPAPPQEGEYEPIEPPEGK